jgi:hypothetical protein
MTETAFNISEINYDPYDFEIDSDPYPTFRRLRDEAPLYYNEKFDFYALSRFADVKNASIEWNTYRSGKGSVLELIKSGVPMPPGFILFEDPPLTICTAACWRGYSRHDASPRSNPRSARSVRPRLTRSSSRAASTSSPTSGPRCRCERSG